MRAQIRKLIFVTTSFSATAAAVACSDDAPAVRPGFGLDASPDVVVSLPEAAAPEDGGSDADSGTQRDPFDPADEPVSCAGAGPCATRIVAGSNHFCALMSDGTARCWGSDEYGALGGVDPAEGVGPVVVDGLHGATQLSAARSTTCARMGDGTVMCWGSNSFGQLGLDDQQPRSDEREHRTPSQVALRAAAVRVDVGPRNVCAVLTTGKVSCWGTNEQLQLARTDPDFSWVVGPGIAELDPLLVKKTSIGTTTVFALTNDGEVFSWGAVSGKDGFISGRRSSISPDVVPNRVGQLKSVTSLVVGPTLAKDEAGPLEQGLAPSFAPPCGWGGCPPVNMHGHACAISEGEVYCWGRSDIGALCTGLPDEERLPAPVPVKSKAWPQQLAIGDEITCARMTDGSIQCCGADALGRLGPDQTSIYSALLKPIVSFKSHAVQVATSYRAVCALVKDGTVECWGSNQFGELGMSPDEDRHATPVKIAF
ncbi:MAG: hypothetical protein BGO98_26740 [Myxococcales bacterium 68-20]|nr:hypothetical protein [Myxococcales bacterium]OJY30332.1 MAG: hypothetical protein BGO98_26740 [Myxococcales bacterium 68-20]